MSTIYNYDKNSTKLLSFHMNCNPEYMFEHAIISGKLANREFKTFDEYKISCNNKGISYFNENCFNDFMKPNNRKK